MSKLTLILGEKIDPEFWVKYVDPGVWVNITRFASHIYHDHGYDLTQFGFNFKPDVFRV